MVPPLDAVWTPTVLPLDSKRKERVRLEGYLPNDDFVGALMSMVATEFGSHAPAGTGIGTRKLLARR